MKTGVCILVLICFIFSGVTSYLLGYQQAKRRYDVTPIVRTDTFIRIDTVRDSVPVPILQYVIRYDSIPYYVVANDTVRDTTFVRLPIERKEFKTLEYHAVIEGYKPELTFMETYNKRVYVDRKETYKTNPRWGIGLQIGGGTDFKSVTLYIGVGIQYNIITW